MKHIKTAFAFFLAALFFSCASAPETQPADVQIQEEAQQEKTENLCELQENENQKQESAADSIPETAPEAEQQEDIIYEPVEDIEGYYESDPEPVFLEIVPEKPSEEQEEEIPVAEEAETLLPEEKPSEPQLLSEIPSEAEINSQAPAEAEKENGHSIAEAASSSVEKAEQQPAVQSEQEATEADSLPEPTSSSENPPPQTAASQSGLNAENSSQEEPPVPSRSVLMKSSQYLDVAYPGKGWIYLGEENGKQLMRYFGRKIGEQNTLFSLRSKEEGTTVLHFYKNDPLTGTFIDDYLAVTVQGKSTGQQRAVAPDYAETVPPRPEKKELSAQENSAPEPVSDGSASAQRQNEENQSGQQPAASQEEKQNMQKEENAQQQAKNPLSSSAAENGTEAELAASASGSSGRNKTESPHTASGTQDLQTEELLKKARERLEAKQYREALSYLEEFFEKATSRTDEGLYLQGQIFESNSDVRNIRSALDTYETIVRRYPQSTYWTQANNRAIYLKKFYFNIR